MEYKLKCPVSLCTFTHPLVLRCGHTIDKPEFDKIINKKICPVCQVPNDMYETINWSIVECLDLKIQPVKPKHRRISAKDACDLMQAQAQQYADNLIDTVIMEGILTGINARKREYEFVETDPTIRPILLKILQDLGYKVNVVADKFTVRW